MVKNIVTKLHHSNVNVPYGKTEGQDFPNIPDLCNNCAEVLVPTNVLTRIFLRVFDGLQF